MTVRACIHADPGRGEGAMDRREADVWREENGYQL